MYSALLVPAEPPHQGSVAISEYQNTPSPSRLTDTMIARMTGLAEARCSQSATVRSRSVHSRRRSSSSKGGPCGRRGSVRADRLCEMRFEAGERIGPVGPQCSTPRTLAHFVQVAVLPGQAAGGGDEGLLGAGRSEQAVAAIVHVFGRRGCVEGDDRQAAGQGL